MTRTNICLTRGNACHCFDMADLDWWLREVWRLLLDETRRESCFTVRLRKCPWVYGWRILQQNLHVA